MLKHLNIRVTGRVQGVFFRLAAKDKAESLRLAGVARNEPDGSVRLEIEGEEADLQRFVDWCRSGSEYAWVKGLEAEEGTVQRLAGFLIR